MSASHPLARRRIGTVLDVPVFEVDAGRAMEAYGRFPGALVVDDAVLVARELPRRDAARRLAHVIGAHRALAEGATPEAAHAHGYGCERRQRVHTSGALHSAADDVQAALLYDPFRIVCRDHAAARKLLDALDGWSRRVLGGQPVTSGHRAALFSLVKRFVGDCHAWQEDHVLFPAIRLYAARDPDLAGAADAAEHAFAEHTPITAMARAMVNARSDAEAARLTQDYVAATRHHFDEEDHDVYAPADRYLCPTKAAALGKVLHEAHGHACSTGRFEIEIDALHRVYGPRCTCATPRGVGGNCACAGVGDHVAHGTHTRADRAILERLPAPVPRPPPGGG